MKTWQTKRRAFTLVELLVVIAIIGILFVVLISKVDFATEKSKATGVQTDFRSYQVAIETVARENAGLSVLVDNDATGEEKYAELEKALNKNLDPKLHVEIDADGQIRTEAKDPWKEQYLGAYLAPDADGTVKDRGAIVMYSKGSNLKLGTTAATENGVVNIVIESGKETEGSDDYAISTIYTYVNGYGEIQIATKGFSNNQDAVVGGNVTPSDPSDPSDPDDPDQGGSGVTEYVVQLAVNDSAMGSVAFTSDGHSGTSLTLTGTQNVQLTATSNSGYRFIGWYVNDIQVSSSSIYECSVNGENIFTAIFAVQLSAGLYDVDNNLVADWATLTKPVADGGYGMNVEQDYTVISYKTNAASPYYILTNKSALSDGVKLVFDNTVTKVGSYIFYNCTKLKNIDFGSSITSIGESAFYGCSGLTGALTIPNGVTSIGEFAFYGCSGLTGKLVIPDSVTNIERNVFRGCSGFTGKLKIPGSVASIGEYAFWGCSRLTSLDLGSGVTNIENYAFHACSGLTSVAIPDSVTSIGDNAFQDCTGLTSFDLGSGITSIGYQAFVGCSGLTGVYISDLTAWCKITFVNSTANPLYYAKNLYLNNQPIVDLCIPDGITTINSYAFYNATNITGSLSLHDGITNIGDYAFYGCSGLTGTLVIPDGVTNIKSSAFSNCSGLTSLDLGNGVTSIGNFAFYKCSGLTGKLIIPDSAISIGSYAFENCEGLASLDLGSGISSIGEYAFKGCTGLTSLDLGSDVTRVGNSAFSGCSKLTSITIFAVTPPTFGDYMLDYTTALTTIYVPDESVEVYKTTSGWSTRASKIKPLSEKTTE